ncbi:hypothetical protein L5D93_13185 [Paenibacillus thiaminolyticus]|nr:hypothetical protein [Paenibacillus thiaminolyticus]
MKKTLPKRGGLFKGLAAAIALIVLWSSGGRRSARIRRRQSREPSRKCGLARDRRRIRYGRQLLDE